MNSRKISNRYQEISKKSKNINPENQFDLSKAIIPFSKIIGISKAKDIYSGNEKIPFNERDPEYKTIFKQEFANFLHNEFKIYSPVVNFPSF